jgi:heme A synthase
MEEKTSDSLWREKKIAFVTLILFGILILWGNLVAGFGAGLGCPDWPLCHGAVIPKFHSYEVILEYSHRILALLASLSLFTLLFLRFRRVEKKEKPWLFLPLLFLLLQILLGGVVVLLELPSGLTILHFALALLIFSFVFLFWRFPTLPRPSFLPLFLFFLFLIQAILGALVRHYRAGLSCPDFPTCLGEWFPSAEDPRVMLHLLHRTTGYGILLLFLILLAGSWVIPHLKIYRRYLLHFLSGIILQIAIGVGILHSRLNPWVTMIHALFALMFLALSLSLLKLSSERVH